MSTNNSQIAIEKVGAAKICRATGESFQTVNNWKRRGIPDRHAPTVERESGIPVEELCPLVPWARIPDPAWPHASGRPVIDHAAARVAAEASEEEG